MHVSRHLSDDMRYPERNAVIGAESNVVVKKQDGLRDMAKSVDVMKPKLSFLPRARGPTGECPLFLPNSQQSSHCIGV